MIGSNFHAFFSYAFLGLIFIFPMILFFFKIFKIENPKHRMDFYILGLLLPVAGFVLFYSLYEKNCQIGLYPHGIFRNSFEFLCMVGLYTSKFITPILLLAILWAIAKFSVGALYVKGLEKASLLPMGDLSDKISLLVEKRCNQWNIPTPKVVYTKSDKFAASVMGVFKPIILISIPVLENLTIEELDILLTHELVHIKNGDITLGNILYLVRNLMFFSPFSTLLLDGYMIERERVCDQQTADSTYGSKTYAKTLLRVWSILLDRHEAYTVPSVGLIGKKNQMEYRVTSLICGEGTKKKSSFKLNVAKVVFSGSVIMLLWAIC